MRKPINARMLVGYMRVSTDGDRQVLDLQRDALLAAGVDERHLFEVDVNQQLSTTFLLWLRSSKKNTASRASYRMESLRTYKEGIALITGAGSGLGRALALELARRGASLHLSDLDAKGLEQTAALVRSAGGAVQADCVDVRDAAAVRQWVLAPARVDYLFNNAGIVGVAGLTDRYAPSDWEAIIDVNLKGVVNGVHAAYSVMVRQGFGHIVNTASLNGLTPFPLVVPYSATKHAVVGLSKSLRIEAAIKGVRVSVLCPGAIRTPILTSGEWRGCEQVSAERKLKWWERAKPIDPEPWARETLNRVARNEAVIIVPRIARIVAALFQWLPTQAEQIARRDLARTLQLFPELEQAPRLGQAESDRHKAA